MKETLRFTVLEWLSTHEASQSELAAKAKVSQSTISRVVNKEWPTLSPQIKVLCEFLGVTIPERDPRECNELMRVLGEMWDGTKAGEQTLINLLRSIQAYKL